MMATRPNAAKVSSVALLTYELHQCVSSGTLLEPTIKFVNNVQYLKNCNTGYAVRPCHKKSAMNLVYTELK